MRKILKILRGVPGSGKSHLARLLVEAGGSFARGPYEADIFMENEEGEYFFDVKRLGECHAKCRSAVENAMIESASLIVQSNTNITKKEMQPYLDLADQYGYLVQEIIVKADFGSVHRVPTEKILQMKNRFEF